MTDTARTAITRAQPFMRQCGPCDFGIPSVCVCPTEDPRPRVAELVTELEKALAYIEGIRCSQCGTTIHWVENEQAGGWWAHAHHPDDDHDAIPPGSSLVAAVDLDAVSAQAHEAVVREAVARYGNDCGHPNHGSEDHDCAPFTKEATDG